MSGIQTFSSQVPPQAEGDFAVIDFETTGFKYSTSGIPPVGVELAIVQVTSDGIIGECWSTRLNPLRPIEPSAINVHGLTPEMLSGEPTFQSALDEIKSRLTGRTLVAHNAEFDSRILRNELSRFNGHGLRGKQFIFVDTLREMRRLCPELPNHKLGTVLEHHGIHNSAPHRALGDALATAELLGQLLQRGETIEGTRVSLTAKQPNALITMRKVQGVYHVDQEVEAEYDGDDLWRRSLLKKPKRRRDSLSTIHSEGFTTQQSEIRGFQTPPPPVSPARAMAASPAVRGKQTAAVISYQKLILLSAFFGPFGVDRFASKRIATGVLKLITMGGLGIWWAIDYVQAVLGRRKDGNGVAIKAVSSPLTVIVSAVPALFFWTPIFVTAAFNALIGGGHQ